MFWWWVRGKHACVDLIGFFPLVGLRTRALTVGQKTLEATSSMVAKHEKTLKVKNVFIQFVFDTFLAS
jgi:hypothetical protein